MRLLRPLPACLIALLAAPLANGQDQASDQALDPLAQGISAYFDARTSGSDVSSAKGQVASALSELARRGQQSAPLRMGAELGRSLWLSRAFADEKVRHGKVTEEVFASQAFGEEGLRYGYWLPKSYDPEASSYPLLLLVPGRDEDAVEHIKRRWSDPEIRDAAILVSLEMPANPEAWNKVAADGRPGGLTHIMTGLRLARERFAVDPDRVYAVGHAEGVPAILAAGNYRPHRFAGLVGRSGDVDRIPPDNFRNLPTLFGAAGARAKGFLKSIEDSGYDNCTLSPQGSDSEVWSWIQEHPRVAAPEELTLMPADPLKEEIDYLQPFPTWVSWLRVATNAQQSRAEARIERATNTIHIVSEGIAEVTLLLSDELLNLDSPVRVLLNDEERRFTPERNLTGTLERMYRGESDAGCVYTVEKSFTLLPKEELPAAPEPPGLDPRIAELWTRYEADPAASIGLLQEILALEPEHEGAHEALGHLAYEGHWFEAQAELDAFREVFEAEAKAKGFIKYKSRWMHREEAALLRKGQRKHEPSGLWLDRAGQKKVDEDWQLQDFEWVSPAELPELEAGRWKVGGDWLSLEDANRRCSRIDSVWRIPGPEVLLLTTANRQVSFRARKEMRGAIAELRRVFGVEPMLPLRVALMRTEEQYDRLAVGDPEGRQHAVHLNQLHIMHSAFFAESWLSYQDGETVYTGMGVCFWDPSVAYGDRYGVHAARLATGLSFVDAIDPSPKAVGRALKHGLGEDFYDKFYAEKQLPQWLRYGAAVYAERYYRDDSVPADGKPWWTRTWSLENLLRHGGMRPLDEVFDFRLEGRERGDAHRLLIEAGLLVAFMLDGECAEVQAEHEAFRRALALGRLKPSHLASLRGAIVANQGQLQAFATLPEEEGQ